MPGRRLWVSSLALALGGRVFASHAPALERRVALIMGNARYARAPLENAVNDGRLVAGAMKDLGFQVTQLFEATHAEMLRQVTEWLAAASSASVRVVYFAGHGAQYRGRNFLIPLDAALRSEDDLPAQAFQVDDLADRLSRFSGGVNVVVLDACRSVPAAMTPLPGARPRGVKGVDLQSGFVPVAAPRGTLIAYSTSPGAVATDNPQSQNSTYTRNLVAQLAVPGLPVEEVFKRTRAAVLQESNGTQTPWETSSLVGGFCFTPNASGGCGIDVGAPPRLR